MIFPTQLINWAVMMLSHLAIYRPLQSVSTVSCDDLIQAYNCHTHWWRITVLCHHRLPSCLSHGKSGHNHLLGPKYHYWCRSFLDFGSIVIVLVFWGYSSSPKIPSPWKYTFWYAIYLPETSAYKCFCTIRVSYFELWCPGDRYIVLRVLK